MIADLIILAASVAILLVASDKFVEAAASIANRLGISSMVIGLTVVAIGTSLPEAAASVVASLRGHSDIALGNVVGSNICNIGLILGLAAISRRVTCPPEVVGREGFGMLLSTFFLWLIGILAGAISQVVGIVMLVIFAIVILIAFNAGKVEKLIESGLEEAEIDKQKPIYSIILMLVVSLAGVLVSSEFLVSSAVSIAKALDVSENVIALSIVALGTSLPELSVSVAATRRGEGELLIGNILGSNISNILLVLGLSASVSPVQFPQIAIDLDIPIALAFSILLIIFLRTKAGLTRFRGILLLGGYALVLWRCLALA